MDGQQVQQDVAEGSIVGPLELSRAATRSPSATAPKTLSTVDVTAGESSDVVVHRPAEVGGTPVVSVYPTPSDPIGPGKARVLLAHTATTAPADVLVDGQTVFTNIANGEFAQADVAAGAHEVSLLPAGVTGKPILGPLDVTLEAGTITAVYAVGNPKDGSMNVIVRTTGGRRPAPSRPPRSTPARRGWSAGSTCGPSRAAEPHAGRARDRPGGRGRVRLRRGRGRATGGGAPSAPADARAATAAPAAVAQRVGSVVPEPPRRSAAQRPPGRHPRRRHHPQRLPRRTRGHPGRRLVERRLAARRPVRQHPGRGPRRLADPGSRPLRQPAGRSPGRPAPRLVRGAAPDLPGDLPPAAAAGHHRPDARGSTRRTAPGASPWSPAPARTTRRAAATRTSPSSPRRRSARHGARP